MKQVNASQFQKAFTKVADELAQGETVEVTRDGKRLGFFTKAPGGFPLIMPDFAANLASVPLIGPGGEQILAATLDEPLGYES